MLRTFRFSEKTFPLFLLLLCLLTYGVFIPWLGFYWDDWPVILMGKFFGPKTFIDFYTYDRPFSAWTYIVSLPVLGVRPLAWQIFTLLLRIGTGVFFWLTLRRVWPQHRIQTAWMAVIFLIHPVFTLQFISVAFSQHWISALLYVFSLWAMMNSLSDGWKRWIWLILAVGVSALHLWTMEYFLGMEIFRYVVIWLTSDASISIRERLGIWMRHGLPYALVLAAFVIWRWVIFQLPQEDPNEVQFLQDLGNQPFTALLTIGQIILRDLLYMLVQIWADVLDSSRVILSSKFFIFSILFSGVVASILAFYFSKSGSNGREAGWSASAWRRQAMWVGFLAMLLGTMPGWMTYREVLNQPYGNRIAIPALFGLGILTVALIEWISQNQGRKTILLSMLCGIAVYGHLYVANSYREAWDNQKSFYWQLYWRIPALQPGTAFLSDSEVVLRAGDYSTASAINLIYATNFGLDDFPYWFVNMSQRFQPHQMKRLLAGRGLDDSFRSWHFEGDPGGILLINNSVDSCMQILSVNQPENNQLSPVLTQVLPQVNLDRIISEPSIPTLPPAEIFGREPEHTWCYYYQKASLARQSADWAKVVALLKEADQHGYEPAKKSEWLLFVDAYVRTGNFPASAELTNRIQQRDPRLIPLLCTYWSDQTALPASLQKSMLQKLDCRNQSSSN